MFSFLSCRLQAGVPVLLCVCSEDLFASEIEKSLHLGHRNLIGTTYETGHGRPATSNPGRRGGSLFWGTLCWKEVDISLFPAREASGERTLDPQSDMGSVPCVRVV